MRNPPCPSGLRKEAQRYWKTICDNWVLSDDDLEVLRQAVFALDMAYRAREEWVKSGMTYKTGTTERQSPAVQLELKARKQFLASLKALDLVELEDQKNPGRPPG